MNTFDMVVIGNGLVGASLVCALQPFGFKIAVIDKQNCSVQPNPRQSRAIALSYSSVDILKSFQLWDKLEAKATPIQTVHISFKNHFGSPVLTAKEHHLPYLGMVIDAQWLTQTLQEQAMLQTNTRFFCPDNIQDCAFENEIWQITLASGVKLQTTLLVGADGTHSFLRQRLGIEAKTENYQQQALVATLTLKRAHEQRAFERFLEPPNSIALLPLGTNQMKSVWIVEEEKAKEMLALSDTAYLKELQAAFGYRLGQFSGIESRFSYPLNRMNSETLYGKGFVLMGNAANTLHPLAAQGFNLGLRDVKSFVQLVSYGQKHQLNIGQVSVLQRYADLRRQDHFLTQQFTELMLSKKNIKQMGLLASLFLPTFKDLITKQGLGYEWL